MFLQETELSRSVSSLQSLQVNARFNSVALDPESSYREIYLTAVSQSYYNLILLDYSLFQFSWDSKDAWRLAYLPNPWISGAPEAARSVAEWEALEQQGVFSFDEVDQLMGELPYLGAIPPIRFEHSSSQYTEHIHPAAHLHIGRHTDNRWPLARVLSPLTFTMMIVKFYYGSRWCPRSSFAGGSKDDCIDKRLIAELKLSPLVYHFSESERTSLHFSST